MGIDAELYPDIMVKPLRETLIKTIKERRSKMIDPAKVRTLAAEYKKTLSLRDGGAMARKTWKMIKTITTAAEQVEILELVKR